MREAREAAGVRPSDWGSTPDVPWTRSHLSNLEHGRGKPTPEVAELYDRHFAREDAPAYFRRLQAAAAEAEAGERDGGRRHGGLAWRRRRGGLSAGTAHGQPDAPAPNDDREVTATAAAPDNARGAAAAAAAPLAQGRRHARLPVVTLVAAAIVGAALGAGATLWLTKEDDAGGPATGLREVCAEDLVLRASPGKMKGGEPSLVRGDVLYVDRYAPGPGGPDAYAHGTSRGGETREAGWVLERWLCR
jgi:hypothetical protein